MRLKKIVLVKNLGIYAVCSTYSFCAIIKNGK